MPTGMSLEELGKRRDMQIVQLKELELQRQSALPVEVAPLDSLILMVQGEISALDALILSRISGR